MPVVHVETEIEASATDIWDVLTDFETYEEWNPVFVEAHGEAKQNARIWMRVEPSGGPDRDWVMRITEHDEPRRLEWVGTLLAPFVFRGLHAFELEPLEGDRTLVANHERMNGLLSRFIDIEQFHEEYEAVNEALKQRVESRSRIPTST